TGTFVPPSPQPVRPVLSGFGPSGSGTPTGHTPVPPRAADPEPPVPAAPPPPKRPSYLVEGDDDEMFGNDEFTAPPVIGE
ncbi:hypothetical protein ACFPM7_27475, partial [Actinokineospora guangxiensis]